MPLFQQRPEVLLERVTVAWWQSCAKPTADQAQRAQGAPGALEFVDACDQAEGFRGDLESVSVYRATNSTSIYSHSGEPDDNRRFGGNASALMRKAERLLIESLPVAGRIVPGRMEREDTPLFMYGDKRGGCNA